jgi:anti-sigma regulatory factor (Ser/Thr protein kinase)/NAD-dependent dihydropyrimidine dehydrogenase PreA subunit
MITATYPITGGDFAAAGAATRALKEQLGKLGVEPEVLRRIMIASYEAEMNVVIHARQGNLWARLNQGRIDIEVVDQGPGIPDIELAMKAGFSTAPEKARQLGFGAGMGLPNIRKASDLFEIDSKVGRGTRVRSAIYLKKMAGAETPQNSLAVREGRCRSCLACLAACPTRALRLRDGRPVILQHLCIDCTACLAVCRGAVALRQDAEEQPALEVAEGTVLIVPMPFLNGLPQAGPARVRNALAELGFHELRLTDEWEAALAEAALRYARNEAARLPVISPVCPAAVNLIEAQFPSLIPQLAPFLSPVEAAREEHSLQPLAVAVACPSQASALYAGSLSGRLRILSPAGLTEALRALASGGRPDLSKNEAPRQPGWAVPDASLREGVLQVTGVRHVQRVLEKTEAGVLEGIELLELYLCDQGCWGSPLHPEDPFLSRYRASGGTGRLEGFEAGAGPAGQVSTPSAAEPARALRRTRPFLPRTGTRLDEDMVTAMRKLARIDELTRALPGRDCGLCGAPTCACLAEDIVTGRFPGAGCPLLEDKE